MDLQDINTQYYYRIASLPSVPIGMDIHDLGSLVPVLPDGNISQ